MKTNVDFAASLLLQAAPVMLPPLKSKYGYKCISSTNNDEVLSEDERALYFCFIQNKNVRPICSIKGSIEEDRVIFRMVV